jgi:hypothetical protein
MITRLTRPFSSALKPKRLPPSEDPLKFIRTKPNLLQIAARSPDDQLYPKVKSALDLQPTDFIHFAKQNNAAPFLSFLSAHTNASRDLTLQFIRSVG